MKYLLSILVLLSSINISSAAFFNEVGDAGELVSTVQNTGGGGSLDAINGRLHYDNSSFFDAVDMYKINVTDFSTFSVIVSGALSEDNHLIPEIDASVGVWMFDMNGILVADNFSYFFNDEDDADIQLDVNGMFLLAIAFNGVEPDNFFDLSTGWFKAISNLQELEYTLELTGAEFSVPAPSVLWLLSIGLIALARNSKKAV